MGSLISHPKVKTPKVVYVPAPPAGAAPPVTAPSDPSGAATPEKTSAESLLLRDRGVFGTVLTGFRGLLSLADNSAPRKNLLGE